MREYLKIKVISLAAEARLIRAEERRVRGRIKGAAEGQKSHLRALDALCGLHSHRVSIVRPEARAACLAYAFLRGRTYRQVERTAKSLPDWGKVEKLVVRYGQYDEKYDDIKRRFGLWKGDSLTTFALAAE